MSKQAMPIDTQQVVEKLTGAGVPDQQARAHASVLSEALQDYELRAHEQFVSKLDLVEALAPIHETLIRLEANLVALNAKVDALEAKLDKKIEALELRIDEKIDTAIAKLKAEVAVWIVSALLFQTGIIAALMLELAT
jgi:hypothetical protein